MTGVFEAGLGIARRDVTATDDTGAGHRHEKGQRREPNCETPAEHAHVHGDQLDIDDRTDDQKDEPGQQRHHAEAGGDESVRLRTQREHNGEQAHRDDAQRHMTGQTLENPWRHHNMQHRGSGGPHGQIPSGMQEIVAGRLGEGDPP